MLSSIRRLMSRHDKLPVALTVSALLALQACGSMEPPEHMRRSSFPDIVNSPAPASAPTSVPAPTRAPTPSATASTTAPSSVNPQNRNLMIELRQVANQSGQDRSVSAQGSVILSPGNSGGSVSVQGGAGSGTGARSLSQQALVLNGRSVQFSLGQSVPLRVVQSFVRNGQVQSVPSTVLIERSSGFSARPQWGGGDSAEVEISAGLAPGAVAGGSQSNTSTTLQVPIGQWVTMAESTDEQSQSNRGILSRSSAQSTSSLRVEMRLSVR
jgi:hypothetical protein